MTWTIWKSLGIAVLLAEIILGAGALTLPREFGGYLLIAMFVALAFVPVLAAIDLHQLRY